MSNFEGQDREASATKGLKRGLLQAFVGLKSQPVYGKYDGVLSYQWPVLKRPRILWFRK